MVFFYNVDKFNQPLNNWNVSNVTGMGNMFYDAKVFYQDISSWCVTKITSLPPSFAYGVPAIPFTTKTTFHPKWGTCPAR